MSFGKCAKISPKAPEVDYFFTVFLRWSTLKVIKNYKIDSSATHIAMDLGLTLYSCYMTSSSKPNSLSFPIPIPLLRHHTSANTTDCKRNPTLSHLLYLTRFWRGTETKRNEKFGYCGLGIAPMNKLVPLTWLWWALSSYRIFTLHWTLLFRHRRM